MDRTTSIGPSNGFLDSNVHSETLIKPINALELGEIIFDDIEASFLGTWDIKFNEKSVDVAHLLEAARHIRHTDIPVAFPTETVYGLGADASRSSAVRGIFKAKQRPADNPLIVHICSLAQLRGLLDPGNSTILSFPIYPINAFRDPIPEIYHSLIQSFWPGPLTILLPNPPNSSLAPEVTAGLPTFGVRMPSSLLALALIKTANVPLAAPSANTSTKPSPTTAQHVKYDLDGRIEMILDGGPCDVGVESTVVDGLTNPPCVLRPGGVSLEQLRHCRGWENVVVAYTDGIEEGKAPRAPGMKYKHYSPQAKIILVDAGLSGRVVDRNIARYIERGIRHIGILRTMKWQPVHLGDSLTTTYLCGLNPSHETPNSPHIVQSLSIPISKDSDLFIESFPLGTDPSTIARNLFSAMREMDDRRVEVIVVEGIENGAGDAAAAVMNRLRKAAEVEIKSENE